MMILPNGALLDCLQFCGTAIMRALPKYIAVPNILEEIILTPHLSPVFALMMLNVHARAHS
eukprot:7713573-Karenia_brevis.AAC.1